VLTALRLSARLGDEDGVARAADRFDAILASAVEVPRGWCNGLAGLAMVGSEILPRADRRLGNLARRMTSLDGAGPVDVSVCHGLGGVLQTLVHLARRCDADWPLELAEHHLRQVCSAAERSGCITGVPNRTNLPGYFLGWSGFADSAIVLELELQGQSSWLPLAFTPATDAAAAFAPATSGAAA